MKINESQLRKIIKESIKKVLNEGKVVNNKPWCSSQQYKDGYEATLRNRADWNDFLNDKSLHNNPKDMIRRAEEIIDSNDQRKREEWEKSEQKHSDRQDKYYKASPDFSNENRIKFVAQWIRNHYDREEWQDLSIEQKREAIEWANNDFYDTGVNRYIDNDEFEDEEY